MKSYPDKRALKILFDTYWTSKGWHKNAQPIVTPENFAYAKSKGLMFDPVYLTHDETIQWAMATVQGVDKDEVVDSFLASLSSGRLDLRSALGSYVVLRNLNEHPLEDFNSGYCATCRYFHRTKLVQDASVANFKRFKWGLIYYEDVFQAAFDLQQFQLAPKLAVTQADIFIWKEIIAAIEAAPIKTTSSSLQRYFPKSLPSNKSERGNIVNILGLCGILSTKERPGYTNQFIPYHQREQRSDVLYPACWWKRSDGLNKEMLHHWFGAFL